MGGAIVTAPSEISDEKMEQAREVETGTDAGLSQLPEMGNSPPFTTGHDFVTI